MASQIAHIIYDNSFFEKLDKSEINGLILPAEKLNRDEFMLGSIFPDIRRVDRTIKRKETHMHFNIIDLDFFGLTSFEAGWKFHLYCDMRREEILNKYNFYRLRYAADHYGHPAKIFEDELLYSYYNNWEKLSLYFRSPPFFSVLDSVSEDSFRLWYAIVSRYLEKKPDDVTMRTFLLKQVNLDAKINMLVEAVGKLRKNKRVTEILLKIKDEII
ncbi:MAG TPA: hypothetical protein VK255_01525 [Patescibacteria group bacterium]|nr:hypothetical protein [Patescibacteria group bacterium]